jgi:acetyl-CoA carboxylase carboxyl transferase subunit alpha
MPGNVLDFEKPIAQLEERIAQVKRLTREEGIDRSQEIAVLEAHVERLRREIYQNLTPWDKTLIARHPARPFTLDYVRLICDDFTELHGDRLFGDDPAMVAGLARIGDRRLLVIGQQKGRDIHERQRRNFGSARPEGYRKALRLMKLAEKFGRPIVSLVDTPAADAGVASEERGISEAIARNMREMFLLTVPIIVVNIGEGGSGGAIGIGVGDRVLMLEHAVYSVIPPEGCAAIIWKDAKRGPEAAERLRITAEHALRFGVVDEVIAEPLGGAHRDYDRAAKAVREAVLRHLEEVERMPAAERLERRYLRFRRIGEYSEYGEYPDMNGNG